jgi:hypothetical protein
MKNAKKITFPIVAPETIAHFIALTSNVINCDVLKSGGKPREV